MLCNQHRQSWFSGERTAQPVWRTPKSDFCIKGCPRKDNRTEGVRGRIIGYNRTSTWAVWGDGGLSA